MSTRSANGEWELAKDKDGIKVFLKTVPGSKIKEFKGVTNIKSSLDSILAVLNDTEACPKWIHNCKDPLKLSEISFNEGYVYQVINFPFPVKDRDLILHSVMTQNADTKEVAIQLTAVPDYISETKNVRIKSSDGFYLLKPLPDGSLEVTWQHHTEPGGRIPKWLVNSLLVDTPFKTLRDLRQIVKEEKYQRARLKYSPSGLAVGWDVKDW
ncbi:MAG: START domain-containing protein [Thermodesulfobacteriota bacterium]